MLNGYGLSETHYGGYAELARVKGDWLVRLPGAFTAAEAMAIGTAGYTAMLAVMALEDAGVTQDGGAVLVTGAAGGVGSVAIAVLAKLGYRVIASTGRPEEGAYLKSLGAVETIPRVELAGEPRIAGQGALGGRRRQRRLEDARQCSRLDLLRWRGCGVRARRRHGFADERGTLHPARRFASGNRFRADADAAPPQGLGASRPRSRREETRRDDEDDQARISVRQAAEDILAGKVRGRIVVEIA